MKWLVALLCTNFFLKSYGPFEGDEEICTPSLKKAASDN